MAETDQDHLCTLARVTEKSTPGEKARAKCKKLGWVPSMIHAIHGWVWHPQNPIQNGHAAREAAPGSRPSSSSHLHLRLSTSSLCSDSMHQISNSSTSAPPSPCRSILHLQLLSNTHSSRNSHPQKGEVRLHHLPYPTKPYFFRTHLSVPGPEIRRQSSWLTSIIHAELGFFFIFSMLQHSQPPGLCCQYLLRCRNLTSRKMKTERNTA
jgi:hypothetical protein